MVTKSGSMFLNSVNVEEEVKIKHYIAQKLEDCIKEVRHKMSFKS